MFKKLILMMYSRREERRVREVKMSKLGKFEIWRDHPQVMIRLKCVTWI